MIIKNLREMHLHIFIEEHRFHFYVEYCYCNELPTYIIILSRKKEGYPSHIQPPGSP